MSRRHKAPDLTGPVVRLRHTTRQGDWRMYFYDGELPIEGAVLTIPASRPEWIQRAWIQGFRMTAEGRVIADLAKHIRAELADEAETPVEPETPTETAQSGEENTNEGPSDRGQSVEDDGVRSSEPDRDGSLPEGGVDGSVGGEPSDGGDGDEPAD